MEEAAASPVAEDLRPSVAVVASPAEAAEEEVDKIRGCGNASSLK